MQNYEFMRNAGFAVPSDFDPWSQVAPEKASAVDGTDLILRAGDFPAAGEAAELLLCTWSERARYDVSDVDGPRQLLALWAQAGS